jgi:hypothetical protein
MMDTHVYCSMTTDKHHSKVQADHSEDSNTSSDEEDDRDYTIRLTDAELLAACEGRTARKGARAEQPAKLARVDALLATAGRNTSIDIDDEETVSENSAGIKRKNDASDDGKKKKKKTKKENKSKTGSDLFDDPKSSKKSKEKKRKKDKKEKSKRKKKSRDD